MFDGFCRVQYTGRVTSINMNRRQSVEVIGIDWYLIVIRGVLSDFFWPAVNKWWLFQLGRYKGVNVVKLRRVYLVVIEIIRSWYNNIVDPCDAECIWQKA